MINFNWTLFTNSAVKWIQKRACETVREAISEFRYIYREPHKKMLKLIGGSPKDRTEPGDQFKL